jgi:hypothetical protein
MSNIGGAKTGLLIVLAFSSDGVPRDIARLHCVGADNLEKIVVAQSKFANCCQQMVPEASGAP